ncbi:MAG: hypothetical protein V2B20_15965 [Pseudomonadota bacterium]
MHIIFYKSKLCPRCFLVKKQLLAICQEHPHFQIEEVEILTSPLRTFRDGINMVPALKIGDDILSGMYLSKKKIIDFITQFSSKNL